MIVSQSKFNFLFRIFIGKFLGLQGFYTCDLHMILHIFMLHVKYCFTSGDIGWFSTSNSIQFEIYIGHSSFLTEDL